MKFIRGLFGFNARGQALDEGEPTDKQRHQVRYCLRFVQAARDQAEHSTDNSGWTRSAKRTIAALQRSPI
ncbi:hypothetical protein DF105_20555 [Burkholderia stagnalis]|nr:hypothetical protein DF149_16280 [Burkholderia stagnalis]RQQ31934.1 hypothetical protein DF148_20605 [Burkholderia stagnalis]RQY20174.1 hypothetical protein DF117_17945 [Burkholderia stagnalis]RQY53514.1 hypothetical protein DF111_20935 [Burkholderia stagnalis]RQY55007.1 hypothetical protein DF112_15550 [Burkholderia stagnalis]